MDEPASKRQRTEDKQTGDAITLISDSSSPPHEMVTSAPAFGQTVAMTQTQATTLSEQDQVKESFDKLLDPKH